MSGPNLERLRDRFHRDPKNGWLAGICAGVADTLGTDPAFLRVGFVVAGVFLPKITIAVYLVAWILLDERRSGSARPHHLTQPIVDEETNTFTQQCQTPIIASEPRTWSES